MCFHIARFARASLCSVLFGVLPGCSTTPLDAVIAQDSGASSGGSAPDAGACFAPAPGRFVMKSALNGQCLGSGDPTMVFGNPAFLTRFDADCTPPAQTWDLAPAGALGIFSLRNEGTADDLDVRLAGMQSGTPVIVYPSTGLDNQRFEIRPRFGSIYELRPQHAPISCVEAAGLGAVISPCAPGDVGQAWQLERSGCL